MLGGAGLVLFASVAVSGIQTLAKVDLSDTRNLTVVSVSLALGLIPSTVPGLYAHLPAQAQLFLGSGITAASLCAILLNILFNIVGSDRPRPSATATVAEHAPEPGDLAEH